MDTTEKKDTVRFIHDIYRKEYGQATTSLQKMIENKIKNKIKTCLSQEK